MSALAKPMVHSTTATKSSMVNIEHVAAISKVSYPAIGNKPAKHHLIFILNNGQKTVWSFAASATRDTEYTNLLGDVSIAVA